MYISIILLFDSFSSLLLYLLKLCFRFLLIRLQDQRMKQRIVIKIWYSYVTSGIKRNVDDWWCLHNFLYHSSASYPGICRDRKRGREKYSVTTFLKPTKILFHVNIYVRDEPLLSFSFSHLLGDKSCNCQHFVIKCISTIAISTFSKVLIIFYNNCVSIEFQLFIRFISEE